MMKHYRALLFVGLTAVITGCGGGGGGGYSPPVNSVCGNGVVEASEQCDDGNSITEVCDYGDTSCTVCSSSCKSINGSTSYCGDGATDVSNNEECDDGNLISNDGCSSVCVPDTAVFAKYYGGIKTYGSYAYSAVQTSDGGYIAAGNISISYRADVWVTKLGIGGKEEWSKTFGGDENDYARSIRQTTDGGYIIAGGTESYGAGGKDEWILKLNSSGNEVWNKTFGGTQDDFAGSAIQAADGGYVFVGAIRDGGSHIHVVKLDTNGDTLWEKIIRGPLHDEGHSIQQTTDGGYIIAGSTDTDGWGLYDYWIIKIDANGNTLWDKTYGGGMRDMPNEILQTADGGYIVVGFKDYNGFVSSESIYIWLIKLDANGDEVWNKTFGGLNNDVGYSVDQTTDGGYIVAGEKDNDGWIAKLDANGSEVWEKQLDSGAIYPYSIKQTTDGGYIVGGGDGDRCWIVKLDSNGDCPGCVFK